MTKELTCTSGVEVGGAEPPVKLDDLNIESDYHHHPSELVKGGVSTTKDVTRVRN
jgi:hypothetical protein